VILQACLLAGPLLIPPKARKPTRPPTNLPTCELIHCPACPAFVCVLPSVNLPGYSYSITAAGTPSAAPCGPDSYSPGYKKQRACVPCPTGFTTAGAVQAKSPTACGKHHSEYHCNTWNHVAVAAALGCSCTCIDVSPGGRLAKGSLHNYRTSTGKGALQAGIVCLDPPNISFSLSQDLSGLAVSDIMVLPSLPVCACSCACWLLPQGSWPGGPMPQGRVEVRHWHRRQLHTLCTGGDNRGNGSHF
jgi:hypothetical protein